MARPRSLLADLRLAFSLGALLIGLAAATFADVTLRHAMRIERSAVLVSESQRILKDLEAPQDPDSPRKAPESTQVDWWLMSPDGTRVMQSAGSRFLRAIPWNRVGEEPAEFRTDRHHLYSAGAYGTPLGILWVAMDRSAELQVVSHFRSDISILLLAITASAGFIGHVIARRGLRPLRQIRDETARIEAQDLHHRLDASRFPEELADLVGALNGALGRLETAFARLEAFSSDLAHELRTPLQNFRAELEGLILRPKPDLDLPEALGSLLEELARLDRMVDQMLFLARSSVPGTHVERQPLAATALLQEVAGFFGAAAEEAAVRIRVEAPPGLLVHADPRLLNRAIQNLVANALRHTPYGGTITLSGRDAGGAAEVAVSDTGEGVPMDLLGRLGDRFLRIEPGRARTRGGAGLGLAIVKGIAELHGGSFSVESAPDRGTTVRLRFPDPA